MIGGGIEAIGVGTVELPTKTGPNSNGIIRLENVLHAPKALCNIIGGPILENYNVTTNFGSPDGPGAIVDLHSGQPVAYFKPLNEGRRLMDVQLSDPPVGPSVGNSAFEPGVSYMIHAFWPAEERQRFESTRSFTSAERAWVKKHFGNEFKFLQTYGLSIYKDEDREEGRAIVRTLMSNDDSD